MSTYPDPYDAIEDMLAKIVTAGGLGFQETFGYWPKDWGSQSPVLMLDFGGWFPRATPAKIQPIRIVYGIWIARTVDSNASEKALTKQAAALANFVDGWNVAEYVDFTSPDYEIVRGLSHRFEIGVIEVDWKGA